MNKKIYGETASLFLFQAVQDTPNSIGKSSMANNVSVFKLTDDDWRESFNVNTSVNYFDLVKVSFLQLDDNEGWRVCCWGDDDFGLEKDFVNEREAWASFVSVIGMEKVSISELKILGFNGA